MGNLVVAGLQFLTDNDWILFHSKAARLSFSKDQEIIRQGAPPPDP